MLQMNALFDKCLWLGNGSVHVVFTGIKAGNNSPHKHKKGFITTVTSEFDF